jgi:hypothetical protein
MCIESHMIQGQLKHYTIGYIWLFYSQLQILFLDTMQVQSSGPAYTEQEQSRITNRQSYMYLAFGL